MADSPTDGPPRQTTKLGHSRPISSVDDPKNPQHSLPLRMSFDPRNDAKPPLIRGFDALGLGMPRDELVEMLALHEEAVPFDHTRLSDLERGLYLVGSEPETKRHRARGKSAHWYGFVPVAALRLACVERLLGARPARVRERVRRALTFADRGPLKSVGPGVYRDAVVVAGAMMALGEAARAAAWLERLGDRDADLAWVSTYGADDLRPKTRHRAWAGLRAALRAFAAGRDDEAIELTTRTRKAVSAFVARPTFGLLDAHAALIAAAANRDVSGVDHEVSRTDVAWRRMFALPEFELDVRVAIDFIASGILVVAHERGVAVTSRPALGLPAPEPEWVRGLVVADRGTDFACPCCGAGVRLQSPFLREAWPSLREWIVSMGPIDAWGHRFERVPDASGSHVASVLSPPSAWSR